MSQRQRSEILPANSHTSELVYNAQKIQYTIIQLYKVSPKNYNTFILLQQLLSTADHISNSEHAIELNV